MRTVTAATSIELASELVSKLLANLKGATTVSKPNTTLGWKGPFVGK